LVGFEAAETPQHYHHFAFQDQETVVSDVD
jgi:hypothetical protein